MKSDALNISIKDITKTYGEFFALKDQCKFNNCLHLEEPKCAVKDALENDELHWSRYQSYKQIIEGDEENYRRNVYDQQP